MDPPVIYQHPLAYLLGLEGLALLRAFSGGYDGEFTLERFREIRELLDSADELGATAAHVSRPAAEHLAAIIWHFQLASA